MILTTATRFEFLSSCLIALQAKLFIAGYKAFPGRWLESAQRGLAGIQDSTKPQEEMWNPEGMQQITSVSGTDFA